LLTQRSWTSLIGDGVQEVGASRDRASWWSQPRLLEHFRCFITPKRVIGSRCSNWPQCRARRARTARRAGSGCRVRERSENNLVHDEHYSDQLSHVKWLAQTGANHHGASSGFLQRLRAGARSSPRAALPWYRAYTSAGNAASRRRLERARRPRPRAGSRRTRRGVASRHVDQLVAPPQPGTRAVWRQLRSGPRRSPPAGYGTATLTSVRP